MKETKDNLTILLEHLEKDNIAFTSPWLTTPKAAKYCGDLSSAYFNQMRTEREGPKYYKIGSRIVYNKQDLDEWIRSHGNGNGNGK